jgi:hypothetical protein
MADRNKRFERVRQNESNRPHRRSQPKSSCSSSFESVRPHFTSRTHPIDPFLPNQINTLSSLLNDLFVMHPFCSHRPDSLPAIITMDQKQLIDDASESNSANHHPHASHSSSSIDHPKSESNHFSRSAVKLFSLGTRNRNSSSLPEVKVPDSESTHSSPAAVISPTEQLQLTTLTGSHVAPMSDIVACKDSRRSSVSRDTSFSSDWQSHCHKPILLGAANQNDAKQRSANRRLLITTVLCAFFMVVELVGGYLANSLSIMTDAAHLFSDIASFALSLLAVHLSSRRSNRRFTFGYQRAEILGAVCSILLIWILTAVVVWLAIERLLTMDFEIESTVMMTVSLFGVGVNILMGKRT